MTQRGAVLGRVFASPTLRRAALAFLGFSCAEHGVWVAMIVYAYQQGGTTEAAVIAVVQLLPAAAVAPWASRLADRRGGAVGLFIGYFVQALAMGLTAALLFLDAPAVAAYGGAVVAASAVTLTRPAQAALVPTLVEKPAELTAANAVIGWTESISLFVGPALTGLLIGISGPAASFAGFGVAVTGSALLVAGIARHSWQATGAAASEDDARDLGVIAALRDQPGAAALLGVCSIQFVAYGALDVLIVVLAVELLSLGASGAGYLNAAFGAGGVVGGLGTLWLVGRKHLALPVVASVLGWGVAFLMIGAFPSAAGAFLLFAGAGAAWTMLDVAGRTLLQRALPRDVRGRVFGVLEGLSMLSLALGSLLVPALAALGGPRVAVGGIGVLLILVAVASFGLVRNLDRAAAPVAEELRLLRASPLFNMLSAPVLEDLARSLVPVQVPAGEEFVREGGPGERFYLVGAGTVAVSARGRQLAELGPGDGFGEIALLRDGIRTSTVTSLEPLTLYASQRHPHELASSRPERRCSAVHPAAAPDGDRAIESWLVCADSDRQAELVAALGFRSSLPIIKVRRTTVLEGAAPGDRLSCRRQWPAAGLVPPPRRARRGTLGGCTGTTGYNVRSTITVAIEKSICRPKRLRIRIRAFGGVDCRGSAYPCPSVGYLATAVRTVSGC